jgi:hypothetical protein
MNERKRRHKSDWNDIAKGWKEKEFRSSLFVKVPKEEENLIDHTEGGSS